MGGSGWRRKPGPSPLRLQVPQPGIEPGSPPSEGGVLIRWTTRACRRARRSVCRPLCRLPPTSKSAQWESNPHIRHGKATGSRYIMGAKADRASGGSRTRNTDLGRRCVPATPQMPSVGPGGLEPPPVGLKGPDAAASTLIPFGPEKRNRPGFLVPRPARWIAFRPRGHPVSPAVWSFAARRPTRSATVMRFRELVYREVMIIV